MDTIRTSPLAESVARSIVSQLGGVKALAGQTIRSDRYRISASVAFRRARVEVDVCGWDPHEEEGMKIAFWRVEKLRLSRADRMRHLECGFISDHLRRRIERVATHLIELAREELDPPRH